jgi:hypothetical protein
LEIFDEVAPETGLRVLPTQIPAPEGKQYLAILIAGNQDEANVVMANLMSYVQDMHETAEQKQAENEIVGSNGEPLEDEPSIILP